MYTLITTMKFHESSRLQDELYCLSRNAAHSLVQRIFVICNEDPAMIGRTYVKSHSKVALVHQRERPSFQDAFALAARNVAKGSRIIVANADIYFDATLEKLTRLDLSSTFLALTRREARRNNVRDRPTHRTRVMTESFRLHNYFATRTGAADVWIFQNPIWSRAIGNVEIGTTYCDHVMAYQAEQLGYRVRNPCLDVRAWHLHPHRVSRRIDRSAEEVEQYYGLKPPVLVPFCSIQEILDEERGSTQRFGPPRRASNSTTPDVPRRIVPPNGSRARLPRCLRW